MCCKDCTDRHRNCHSVCERYKAACKERKRLKDRDYNRDVVGYLSDQVHKVQRARIKMKNKFIGKEYD